MAEVLITLGIIGVVAAMTLPSLVGNYKRKQNTTKLKKFYSVMNQAIIRSVIDNGEVQSWEKEGGLHGDIEDEEGNKDYGANYSILEEYWKRYLAPYIVVLSFEKVDSEISSDSVASEAMAAFADGSVMYLHNGNCVDITYDLNGTKSPNERGKDLFKFVICSEEKCQQQTWLKKEYCGRFALAADSMSTSQNNAKSNCLNKKSGSDCELYLFMNNFEYPKDYPLSF